MLDAQLVLVDYGCQEVVRADHDEELFFEEQNPVIEEKLNEHLCLSESSGEILKFCENCAHFSLQYS